ncbi:TPA: cation-transporting P-type ATPase, partial [Legionella pneumophila]|nr:cation-transporting P-type ATPase [Legionella pneumophila]
INGEGTLTVRATKKFADNTLSRIIFLVEKAQDRKGRSQRFIERFGNLYSPLVLLVGILIATLPPLFGQPWQEWVIRATVFIVAAAPCALVISIPITLVAALGTASRNGILLKGGLYLEQL